MGMADDARKMTAGHKEAVEAANKANREGLTRWIADVEELAQEFCQDARQAGIRPRGTRLFSLHLPETYPDGYGDIAYQRVVISRSGKIWQAQGTFSGPDQKGKPLRKLRPFRSLEGERVTYVSKADLRNDFERNLAVFIKSRNT